MSSSDKDDNQTGVKVSQTSHKCDNTMFKKFAEFTLNALKTNIKEVNKSSNNFTLFGLFFNSKKKAILSKELDGTNIIEFFTILNICECCCRYFQNGLKNNTNSMAMGSNK